MFGRSRLAFLYIFISISSTTTSTTNAFQPGLPIYHHAATRSNLFREYDDIKRRRTGQPSTSTRTSTSTLASLYDRLRRRKNSNGHKSSSTSLNMVFTTPSSVIEQASTTILLDDLIDESVRSVARKTVMMHFNPSSGWIWGRWKGTVFSETWRTCVINMIYAMLITCVYKINETAFTKNLAGFNILWGQLLSVTTFTLTFFVNQSYALWRNCYGYSRRIQGRLNDLNMTMAAHAKRVEPKKKDEESSVSSTPSSTAVSSPTTLSTTPSSSSSTTKMDDQVMSMSAGAVNSFTNGAVNGAASSSSINGDTINNSNSSPINGAAASSTVINGDTNNNDNSSPINGAAASSSEYENFTQRFSTYTEPAREVLELMARYTRVFNLLTYASFTGSHRPLLTPQGMRRMVDRGIITESERLILSDVQLPVTQRHNALLLWMMRLFEDARQAGHLEGSSGFEQQFLEKCHVIRGQYGAIGDELQGRMPLAYAHIVQVLVDVILWMYPFMAFSTGMTPFLSVIGTGLLTMFYQGLVNLAKQFLDPYDNESYGKGEDPLCIDTLIAESNAGSVRWMNGLAEVPYSVDKVKDGDLLEYQLPLRGWTIEQTIEREEAARVAQALKEAEEAEMRLAEEIGLVEPTPLIEIDEDIEILMRAEDDDGECDPDQSLTMEEALEIMDECTEKVP
jgi:hypothetical protein